MNYPVSSEIFSTCFLTHAVTITTDSHVTPKPTAEVKDVKKSANEPNKVISPVGVCLIFRIEEKLIKSESIRLYL